MKRLLLSVLSVALLAGAVARAADDKKSPTTAPTTKPANTMCIMNPQDPVDDRETVVYEGKTIGFCCEDCKRDFLKDPKKYIDRLK